MDINISTSFTIVQSLLIITLFILGLLLLLLPDGKKKQNLSLSLFLSIISIHILIDLTIDYPIFNHLKIHLFPSILIFLYAPLQYFYTIKFLGGEVQNQWKHLMLCFVFIGIYWIYGFSNIIYFPAYGVQYIIYAYWINRLVQQHNWDKSIGKIWILFLVYSFGLIWFFAFSANAISLFGFPYWADQLELISYIVATLFFIGLLYFTMSQPSLFMNVRISKSNQNRVVKDISDAEKERIEQLKILFEKEKIFKDPDLNRIMLANQLNISQQQLSKEINQHFKMNLSELLNHYRIHEAQNLLKDSNLNIKEIYYEIGYNSRSAFNTAFKKIVKKTPSQFKNEK